MLSFNDAIHTTLANTARLSPERAPVRNSLGMVLAEDVASDVDMPPFDKSAMDGFAVVASDLAEAPRVLRVTQEVPAGAVPADVVRPGECARIMTGAPVPEGADTVVMVEDTEAGPGDGEVTFLEPAEARRNICWRAEDVRTGDVVLRAGHAIRAPEIATLAACGRAQVLVYRKPTVAVLSTGNELVPVDCVPESGQIRDTNSHYVAARLARMGIEATRLGIAPDTPDGLRAALAKGIEHDALVISGGVSMGDYDLVPGILRELGTEIFFDKVAMKPGKPTVFGRCGGTAVFGLPGNPVSVLAVTELFVVPALRTMMGFAAVHPPRRKVTLLERARHKTGRVAHLPGLLKEGDEGPTARPLPYHGSAHIHALTQANCLIVVPADVAAVEPGAAVEVIELSL